MGIFGVARVLRHCGIANHTSRSRRRGPLKLKLAKVLRTSSVPATRSGFALNRYGAVTKREVSSAPFDIVGLCSAPANEQQMFCSEAKKAVGW